MSHLRKTTEAGGWILLALVIAAIVYLLTKGKSAIFGSVSQSLTTPQSSAADITVAGRAQGPIGTLGGVKQVLTGLVPDDPSVPTSYLDDNGTLWDWNPSGKQWTISATQPALPFLQPASTLPS